jgi:hypothetical protein
MMRVIGLLLLLPVALLVLARVSSASHITEMVDVTGDGAGNGLDEPNDVAVDSNGNVYVTGYRSDNVLKISPDGTVAEVLDSSSHGNTFNSPLSIAVDPSNNLYVSAHGLDTGDEPFVIKVTPTGTITSLIDETGDGSGNTLGSPQDVALDASGMSISRAPGPTTSSKSHRVESSLRSSTQPGMAAGTSSTIRLP